MGAVWLVFGVKLRRYWRSWLTLTVLVVIVSGFVLAATAAGRVPVAGGAQGDGG